MGNRVLIVVDQTIREGMQYRGLMFSFAERLRILDVGKTDVNLLSKCADFLINQLNI